MKLTPAMRDALDQCRREPLRRIFDDKPGKPAWPAHPATIHALERHGLIERQDGRNRHAWIVWVWKITDAGQTVLNPPPLVLADKPRFLSRPSRTTGDYTSSRHRAIDELEPVNLDAEWVKRGKVNRANAQNRKQRARSARAA